MTSVHLDSLRSRQESARGWAACGRLAAFRTLTAGKVTCEDCRATPAFRTARTPGSLPAPPAPLPGCGDARGTDAGYQRHLKGYRGSRPTVPCQACSRAHSLATGRMAREGRCARGLGWPLQEES